MAVGGHFVALCDCLDHLLFITNYGNRNLFSTVEIVLAAPISVINAKHVRFIADFFLIQAF